MADFNQAINITPNYAPAYLYRGLTYYNEAEYERAIADFDQAIRLAPNLALVREYLQRAQDVLKTRPAKSPALSTAPTSPEVRVALVIGNSSYHSAEYLPNLRRDAQAVADALRKAGFQTVELAMDLDREAMMNTLRSFRERADNADWALIYFSRPRHRDQWGQLSHSH
jgi:tetratricopeptide (TPR) repeat protein